MVPSLCRLGECPQCILQMNESREKNVTVVDRNGTMKGDRYGREKRLL